MPDWPNRPGKQAISSASRASKGLGGDETTVSSCSPARPAPPTHTYTYAYTRARTRASKAMAHHGDVRPSRSVLCLLGSGLRKGQLGHGGHHLPSPINQHGDMSTQYLEA